MEVLTTLLVIWAFTFITSYIMNTAQRSNEMKQAERAEAERQKRINQLYGRD